MKNIDVDTKNCVSNLSLQRYRTKKTEGDKSYPEDIPTMGIDGEGSEA